MSLKRQYKNIVGAGVICTKRFFTNIQFSLLSSWNRDSGVVDQQVSGSTSEQPTTSARRIGLRNEQDERLQRLISILIKNV